MTKPSPHALNRRQLLHSIGGLALTTPLLACNSRPVAVADTAGSTATGRCFLTPAETTGPYPLSQLRASPQLRRREIHEGRPGVLLQLQLKLLNADAGCAPVSDAEVYLWHCDKDGSYSGYAQTGSKADDTFCRGMQAADQEGMVRFDTIYPGWYPGRVTHMHFQVFRENKVFTSQLAFPLANNRAVYADPAYASQGQNHTVSKLSDDFEFDDDGAEHQTVNMSTAADGTLVATLEVGLQG